MLEIEPNDARERQALVVGSRRVDNASSRKTELFPKLLEKLALAGIHGGLLDDEHAGEQRHAEVLARGRVAWRKVVQRGPRGGGPIFENRLAAPLRQQLSA